MQRQLRKWCHVQLAAAIESLNMDDVGPWCNVDSRSMITLQFPGMTRSLHR